MRNHLAILSLALSWIACSNADHNSQSQVLAHSSSVVQRNLLGGAQIQNDGNTQEPVFDYSGVGNRINVDNINGVFITEGQIRPRRRHENDMDFSKFNPFYWQGRQAHFKVEDASQTPDKSLKFTLTTEWPQNYIPTRGPDFSAIYIGDPSAPSETLRSKFKINLRMDHISDFRVFQATLTPADLIANAADIKKGSILTFEFRFFMDDTFPDFAKQKDRDPHVLSAYYSEFIRIRVGESGLFLDDHNIPNALPSPDRYAGGWTTTPTARVEPWKALQQEAMNLSRANSQNFMTGRTWFHTDFSTGQHVRDASDDKPTVFFESEEKARSGYSATTFNTQSCNTCHVNNGISLLPAVGLPVDNTVVKTFDKSSGINHKSFGGQLQTQGANAEGTLAVASYTTKVVTLDDGTAITLKKPNFQVTSPLDTTNLGLSPRRPQAMIGMGLLEAIPEATVKALAQQSGGTVQIIDGKIGRYGWKADKPTLISQIGAALRNDIGVMSQNFVEVDCGNGCAAGKGQLPNEALDLMETYVSLLGVPPRFNPDGDIVKAGEAVFQRLNCQTCHVSTLITGPSKFPEVANQTIHAFTDLALHDMGPDLADESPLALASFWRTAPLWGLKNVRHSTDDHISEFAAGSIDILWTDTHKIADQNRIQLLHDGRAESLPEAILWHGGAASAAVAGYKALSKADRDALEAYLWDL